MSHRVGRDAMTEHDEVAQLERDLEAEQLRRSFARYVRRFWSTVTNVPLTWNRAIGDVVAVLQRVADGELWRVLIALPSGVGKSTLLALYSAWRLAREPNHRAIHLMHSSSLASTESIRVRRLVEHNEHRALFPYIALAADENTITNWATTSGGRYLAVGEDTAILGRRVREAVLDDPLDANKRFNRDAKQKLWELINGPLITRLDGDRAPIVIVHQRLAVDDPIGRALEQGGWFLLELPAEFEDGTLLAPTVLTRERCEELKKSSRTWRTFYLQKPDAGDGVAIDKSCWRFHAPQGANPNAARPLGCITADKSPTVTTPDEFEAMCISVDPTFGGTKTSNDNCAIQVWGAQGPGRYLLERWSKKSKQREQREQVKAYREKYPRATILIELAAGGAGMIEELQAEGVDRIEGVAVGSMTGGKAARLDNVSPTIEQGFAFLLVGMPGAEGFVAELAGETNHDDDMDACSQAIHWINVNAGEDDVVSIWRRAAERLESADGLTASERKHEEAKLAATKAADHRRRRERLVQLAAREARGEKLSRGERLHLRIWRRNTSNTDH
jgi:predicted phage terminase large subunit-like protein